MGSKTLRKVFIVEHTYCSRQWECPLQGCAIHWRVTDSFVQRFMLAAFTLFQHKLYVLNGDVNMMQPIDYHGDCRQIKNIQKKYLIFYMKRSHNGNESQNTKFDNFKDF